METLMKNLQEQHNIQLLQTTNDLANMETYNEREPPLPPRPKYVSIFRIDGEPILPPLMTTEKRRQMQKIKEKALKVEQRLREHKQRINKQNVECSEDVASQTSRSSLCNTAGNVSQRSQEYFETNLKETEESMMILQNLLEKQQGDKNENVEKVDCGSNTCCDSTPPVIVDENQEKLLKLRKSEILIYDNSTKEIIQVPPERATTTRQLIELDRQANLIYAKAQKPSHLLLAGVDGQGMTAIPSICLNPPTPLAGNRSISDNIQSSDSSKSPVDPADKFNKSLNLTEESSDESFNSMLTHSNGRSSSNRHNKPKHNSKGSPTAVTEVVRNKKPYKKSMNVLNKIHKFEDLSSESNTPISSPEKAYARKSCVMSRSATSPSIKLMSSNRSSSSRSQNIEHDTENSSEIALVRSSSFTLEGPSKALIDHMRQQKTLNEANNSAESQLNSTRTLSRKPSTTPLRAHRDTVESKAKKVQKVDLKSSKQKLQQKTSQSKLAQAAVASLSFHNTSSLTQKSNNIIKPKKSPYDTSKYSQQSLQKSTATPAQLRKSASTSSSINSNKTTKSRVSASPMRTPTSNKPDLPKPTLERETFSQMDKIQRDKFLKLLAQQEEEHRRLQQSFEMQQKMLLEQLNREMVTTQLQSPTKSINSLSQKRPEPFHNNHQLPNKLQNLLNLSGLSSDTKSEKPKQSTVVPPQQSPTLSNNSFNLSLRNSQSQSTSALQSSFSVHSTHPPPLPSPNSNLSSMISSNAANTSMDLSTLSNQTSPDTLCSTTPTNKQTPSNISGVNKSSSRRRLFAADMNTDMTNDTIQLLSSRSTASSSFSALQRLSAEPAEPRITPNKSSMTLSQNGGIRRLQY